MFEIISVIILSIIGCIITTFLLCCYILEPIIFITDKHGSSLKDNFILALGFTSVHIIFFGNICIWVLVALKSLEII